MEQQGHLDTPLITSNTTATTTKHPTHPKIHFEQDEDIYRFINLPPGEVQKNLKDFSMRGLVEIQDKKARAKLVIRKTTV